MTKVVYTKLHLDWRGNTLPCHYKRRSGRWDGKRNSHYWRVQKAFEAVPRQKEL